MKLTRAFSSALVVSAISLSLNPSASAQRRDGSASRDTARGGSVDVSHEGAGRYGTTSVSGTTANGSTYSGSSQHYGRFGSASGSATGANGGTYSASGERAGRYSSGSASATGPDGGSYNASGERYGRFGTGSASATGADGGTYDASVNRAGRYSSGSVNATGPAGGTYDASGQRYGRYGSASATATGPDGGSASASASGWTGYRAGYLYRGNGVYAPANVQVNKPYAAPTGPYQGTQVIARPEYVNYPQYATHPVEVSVQAELQRRGLYTGPIDGAHGAMTQAAISRFQAANGLPVTGTVTPELLRALALSR